MSASEAERGAMAGGASVLGLAAVGYALFGGQRYSADFTQQWVACRALLRGISPYDDAAVQALVPPGAEWPFLPWAYPPWTTLVFAPLGALPLDAAGRLWSLLSAGAIVLAAIWVARASTLAGRAAVAGAASFAFPTLGVVGVGQLVAPAVLGAGLLVAFRGPWTTGLGLLLLATKPHLGLPVALAHLGWTVWTRDRAGLRGWAIGAAAGGLLALACLAVDPTWPQSWPASLDRLRAHETVALCDTCASATTASPALALLLAPVLVGLVLWRRDLWGDVGAAVSSGVLAALIFLPYVRNYDHALAVIPLVALWTRVGRGGRTLLAVAWLLPWTSLGLSRSAGTVPYWLAALLVAAVWSRAPLTAGSRPLASTS